MDALRSLWDSLKSYEAVGWWLFAVSVAMFAITPVVVGWMVMRMPVDYFMTKRRKRVSWWERHPVLKPVVAVGKNVLGAILILAGLVMLVVPGQGLLTVVVGLMLVDFPGKFRLERWLATRPSVWRAINWLRKRAGREPLTRPD
jgi:hypothetical protein